METGKGNRGEYLPADYIYDHMRDAVLMPNRDMARKAWKAAWELIADGLAAGRKVTLPYVGTLYVKRQGPRNFYMPWQGHCSVPARLRLKAMACPSFQKKLEEDFMPRREACGEKT